MTCDSIAVIALPRRSEVLNQETMPESQGRELATVSGFGRPGGWSGAAVDHLFEPPVYQCRPVA
jgi:hypothetical protein